MVFVSIYKFNRSNLIVYLITVVIIESDCCTFRRLIRRVVCWETRANNGRETRKQTTANFVWYIIHWTLVDAHQLRGQQLLDPTARFGQPRAQNKSKVGSLGAAILILRAYQQQQQQQLNSIRLAQIRGGEKVNHCKLIINHSWISYGEQHILV